MQKIMKQIIFKKNNIEENLTSLLPTVVPQLPTSNDVLQLPTNNFAKFSF